MKKLTLNILLLILLLTAASASSLQAAVVNASWPVSADNGISYLSEDPNEPEPEPEFIGGLIGCLDEDPNEPEPECI
jgi:hypothetical protein